MNAVFFGGPGADRVGDEARVVSVQDPMSDRDLGAKFAG